jgi:hypothetical protein
MYDDRGDDDDRFHESAAEDAPQLPVRYVYQDGADFYQEFADTDSSEHLWTAPFKVGMDSALAEKARAEFLTWAEMNAFKAVF